MAMQGVLNTRVKKSRIRSEQDRETLENHWFHFTRKLLMVNGGPAALKNLNKSAYPGDFTTSRPVPSQGMIPSSEKVQQACTHPKEYQTKGANQHGTWTRCSLCQTKTGYQKYGPDNPPPKTKGAVVETYVASEAMGTTRVPMGASSSESPQPLMPDLETAFRGQNQQLVQSTAAVMAQVMTPVVEGFHQALRYQAEESQRAQERQETQMQQSFLALQRIMQQTDPARQPGAAFPALPPEELHRLLAQGFAMASQHPLPEDEDWDSDLADELICSEFPEGRESHLSKRQKRALLNSIESLSKSTEFSDEPKSSVVEVNQEWSQEQNAEPESLSRNEEEPDGQSRTKKEPVSQSRQTREAVSRLTEQKCLTRPVRFDRNVTPSSQELSALGVVNVRRCRHGDLEKRPTSSLKVMELFSPPRITQEAAQAGLQVTEPSNFDLKLGWNALCPEDRKKMWKTIEEQEPGVILMSPDCKMFSQLMNVNLKRIPVEKLTRQQMEALVMWHLCLQVAEHQMKKGRYFVLEQPAGASSWSTHGSKWLMENDEVFFFFFDQCELGLQVCPEGPSRKTTALATNHLGVAAVMSQYQCRRSHEHVRLENGLPKKAQVYPPDMVRSLIQGILMGASEFVGATHVDDVIDEDEAEQEGVERQPRTPGTLQRDLSDQLTEEQKKKITLMHLNMGHLSKDQMLAMLKAAGAKEGVLRYVKDKFRCEHCMRQRKPVERRHAALPRTFSFNRIVALDYFFLSFSNRTFAFLNAICHGTNFQQVGLLRNYEGGVPSSSETWTLFNRVWIQPFGLPETIVCDGGSEFKQSFERSVEQHGILQIITDAASPWQNGKVERHGGWVKERAELEINSGQTTLIESSDLEELVLSIVACKNRWFSRSGYSPCQLVFGANPRVPAELLSDDTLQEIGWQEIETDPFDQDTAAAAYNRSHQIRQRARQLCVEASCREKIRLSSTHRAHKQRQWAIGQWVFVWRKFPGTGQGHLTRARWTGPGIVVLQAGHTVWVSMRARLWKCNSDQLRPASHFESIGAEMARSGELQELVKQGRSSKAGAVDVTLEGTPPPDEEQQLVPTTEVAQPLVHETIRADDNSQQGEGQEHVPLREIRVPAPVIADEDADSATIDSVSDKPLSSKRKSEEPRCDDVVDTDQERLERIAMQTMRRLDREEKIRRLRDRGESAPDLSNSSASASSIPSGSASSTRPDLDKIQEEEDDKETSEQKEELMSHMSEAGIDFFEISGSEACLMAKPYKSKSQEFNMKEATPEEKEGFRASDRAEWETIQDLHAVRVLTLKESRQIRRERPHRILQSRFVRRKKPMPGVGKWKFKSRWCVLGHSDPDSGTYTTYSPMPMTESISIFFQLCTNMNMCVTFCDVTQAFCQSEPLDRPQGGLYVEACEGLGLPAGTLVQLVAPVYGLEDAPIRWHQTVIHFLMELGFQRSLLEPCWYVRRDENNEVEAMILVEVDDLNVAARPELRDQLLDTLASRFRFGKMEYDEADFAGRHVKILPSRIEMNQEKYILEKLHPVKLSLGRKGNKSATLLPDEFESFRSMLYRVAWVAHQTRPEAAGAVSILSSRLKEAVIHDICCLNKLIAHLRNTAQQSLTLHSFNNDDMILISASDAGGVDGLPPPGSNETDTVQGAWVIMAADQLPSASNRTKVSILSWRSSKLRRKVASTLASEALAFSQSLGEVEWIQIMIRDIVKGDVSRKDWTLSLAPHYPVLRENCELAERLQQCHITDAKSLYDALLKESPMSRQDRRTSVELSIILESLQKARSVVRWAPHPRMVADGLTKADITRSNGALEELLRTSRLALWDESEELRLRKTDPKARGRTKGASTRLRQSEANLTALVFPSRINRNFGVMKGYEMRPHMDKAVMLFFQLCLLEVGSVGLERTQDPNAEAFTDGYMRSGFAPDHDDRERGDKGWMDEDGYLYLIGSGPPVSRASKKERRCRGGSDPTLTLGRFKELINRAGEKVAQSDVGSVKGAEGERVILDEVEGFLFLNDETPTRTHLPTYKISFEEVQSSIRRHADVSDVLCPHSMLGEAVGQELGRMGWGAVIIPKASGRSVKPGLLKQGVGVDEPRTRHLVLGHRTLGQILTLKSLARQVVSGGVTLVSTADVSGTVLVTMKELPKGADLTCWEQRKERHRCVRDVPPGGATAFQVPPANLPARSHSVLKDFKTRVESSPGVELRRFGGVNLAKKLEIAECLGVATHRWGYACCLLCEKDAECGKVPALEAASGESGLPGEGLVGSVAAAGGAAAAVAQEAAEAASAPTPARGTAEVVRILGSDKTKPFQVLGLPTVGATSYAVRTAFRRLALLVHPDKNPGEEERCHQALLRAQQAREAALALLASPPKAAEGAGVQAPKGPTRGPAPRPRDDAASAAREPQHRKEFASAEAYVSYALQYVFDEWQRFVDLALGGPNDEKRKKATEKRAVAAAASGGAEGVLRSQVAMQQTSKSVKALQKLLKNQALGNDVLAKVERVCRGMLCKEYVEANQAYLDLAIGNKAWHSEVPTLMEGGMDGLSGVDRGRMSLAQETS
ncbi:Retrovirus-related Pol polyprotein from transposon RE2 (Retro element 2) (AtRE2) [Includes: Protease RE2 [Durusdinium trenchii]|uniref:Pre-mRNA-splicing factor 18 n=1 Tax=Durusdinium trenchii TaxID=1381693 RepID=A0ABP0Q692_9DINO